LVRRSAKIREVVGWLTLCRIGVIPAVDRPGCAEENRDRPDKRGNIVPDSKEVSEGEAALREVERDWNAAARDWNTAALAALYTGDVVFYGGRPNHSVGQAQVRDYFESYAGMFTAVRLALVDQEIRELARGIYLAQGYAAFDFDLTGGGATRAVLRSTLVLTRLSEGWRIAQHHFSAIPVEPPIPPPDGVRN
jgi:uncharacterized protein (TIGR02246 family)